MAIVGSFQEDLDIYLTENRGRTGASKKSDAELSSIGTKSKGELENGKMYSFQYFTPDEFFYDTYPIVIGLGKSIDNHQLGLNLHYIPYEARIPFVSDVVRSFQNVISTQINNAPGNPNAQSRLSEFTYDNLKKSLGRKYNLTYAIRQYRMDRMKKPRMLGYEDWYIGAVNNQNHFFGGNINEAQALYYKNI
jgi:hypothetical protein